MNNTQANVSCVQVIPEKIQELSRRLSMLPEIKYIGTSCNRLCVYFYSGEQLRIPVLGKRSYKVSLPVGFIKPTLHEEILNVCRSLNIAVC